ncbi:MAG: penicillin-insensitive murein endopeptidase [Deltaproteobacteria bacterium]|nr:penicillin-insensitive murein endopeptidase [Nannocystaceae bacterium]
MPTLSVRRVAKWTSWLCGALLLSAPNAALAQEPTPAGTDDSKLPTTVASPPLAAVDHSTDASTSSERGAGAKPKPDRPLITHRVVPGETVDRIAKRYGVTRGELEAWNKLLKRNPGGLKAGWELKVRARIDAPPREKITYSVKFGDTWGEIATKFNVPVSDLRSWNSKVPKQFRAQQKITVYTDPRPRKVRALSESIDPRTAGSHGAGHGLMPLPEFEVPVGAVSVGTPNRGRLIGGIRLPESKDYTIRRPDEAWGSSHTVLNVQQAIAAFRRDSGYDGAVVVGAMSLPKGGRFRPHRSHQSGRDIDIRLPKKKGADPKSDSPNDIDWDAAWLLVKSFMGEGDAEYIFLDYSRQKRLLDAAKRAGATAAELEKAIQYPRSRKTNNGVVRHAEGHLIHVHIRVSCSSDEARCES